MKRLLFSLLMLASWFAAASFSAPARPAQLDAPRLMSINALPVYADDGTTLESLNITAKFATKYLQPDGKTTKTRIITIEFDLVEAGKQSVELDGVVYDYDELGISFVAAAFQEYFKRHPKPLPVRKVNVPEVVRKALREAKKDTP